MNGSMEEIEKLASQLRGQAETHIISLDEIEGHIKNRRMAQLQALFTDERQKEQAYKPFYQYDKKGRRQVGDEEIVYRNHEYLVLRATKGYSQPGKYARKKFGASSELYHGVWVFGIADGRAWIHRLEWDSNFEDDGFEWTREYVLSKMRFAASVDEILSFEVGKVIRLQGDLTAQKVRTLHDDQKSRRNNSVGDAANQFRNEFEKVTLEKNRAELDFRMAELERDAELADRLERADRTKEEQKVLRELNKKYGITARTRIDMLIMQNQYSIQTATIEREKKEQDYENLLANRRTEAEQKFDENFLHLQTRQVNLRVGNHMIIVERAMIQNNEVVVLEDTPAYVIHDEHENRIVTFDAGVYRFGLLARHITDRR